TGPPLDAIPPSLRPVLDGLDRDGYRGFPYNFLEYVGANPDALSDGFLSLFGPELSEEARAHVRHFATNASGEGLDYVLLERLHELRRERDALNRLIEGLRRRIRAMQDRDVKD